MKKHSMDFLHISKKMTYTKLKNGALKYGSVDVLKLTKIKEMVNL